MSDLYPTPTRLALLREVDRPGPGVWQNAAGDSYVGRAPTATGADSGAARPKVTARVQEMAAAGWIELYGPTLPGHIQYWHLTDAGADVLYGYPERAR